MLDHQETSDWRSTAERLFKHTGFTMAWVGFLGAFMTFVSWPIRNAVLVCWDYGSHANFDGGLRVLKGRPLKFSNGEPVPAFHDVVTAFGAFFITAFGLTFLLIMIVRIYECSFTKHGDHRA